MEYVIFPESVSVEGLIYGLQLDLIKLVRTSAVSDVIHVCVIDR